MVAAGLAALAVGVLAYRGVVSLDTTLRDRALANASAVLDLERRLGLDVESDLQRSPLGRGVPGAILTGAYALLYWPFVVGTAVFTLWCRRSSFRLLRNAMAVTGAVGLAVILAFPVAPPRLLPGFEDHVARAAMLGSLAHPSGLFNPYAAMPSFHVGWVLVAALALRRATGSRWALAAPLIMSVAVLTTGNHYVLDVVAGAGLAALGWRVALRMQQAFDEAGWGGTSAVNGARARWMGGSTPSGTPQPRPGDRAGGQRCTAGSGRGGDMQAAAAPISSGPAANAHSTGP